jgi:hypothetical protein
MGETRHSHKIVVGDLFEKFRFEYQAGDEIALGTILERHF